MRLFSHFKKLPFVKGGLKKQDTGHILKLKKHYHRLAKKLVAGKITVEQFASQQSKLQLKLESLADHDGLVKDFLNNHGFSESLERELKTMDRLNISDGVLMALDIDKFKRFNDTLGHPKGDKLIKVYAQIINQNIRSNDLKGRVGGDEFLIFLIGTDIENAQIVAQRIKDNITVKVKEVFPEFKWQQSVSIGLAQIQPQDSLDRLRERADQALYQAKKQRDKMVI